jgi:Uma2 family endonuclease
MIGLAATYKFTAEDFYHLYETGLFNSKDRIELLNGEIIIMQAIGSRHAQAVTNLTTEFGEQGRRRYMISPRNPVVLDRYSMPSRTLRLSR